ncbi:hypothetical protein PIB30_090831, partial [Stylosanthes scabra]|nr:hypothetical protein [Stylosanthes scabra]
SIAWSFIPRGNDTHFTVVLLVRFGALVEIRAYDAAVKDPKVAMTTGAPRKGKETLGAEQSQGVRKRCCTRCGTEGHTRRTCRVREEGAFVQGSNQSSSFPEDSSSFDAFGYGFDAQEFKVIMKSVLILVIHLVDEENSSCRVEVGGRVHEACSQPRMSHRGCPGNGAVGGGNVFLGCQNIHKLYASTSGPFPGSCYRPMIP